MVIRKQWSMARTCKTRQSIYGDR